MELKRVEVDNDYIVNALRFILNLTNPDNVAALHPDFESPVDIAALSYEHLCFSVDNLIKVIEKGYIIEEC